MKLNGESLLACCINSVTVMLGLRSDLAILMKAKMIHIDDTPFHSSASASIQSVALRPSYTNKTCYKICGYH